MVPSHPGIVISCVGGNGFDSVAAAAMVTLTLQFI